MQVQRNEMNRGANAVLLQCLNEFISVDLQTAEMQLDDIEVPGMLNVRAAYRRLDFGQLGQSPIIFSRDFFSGRSKCVAFFQLLDPDCRGDVRQIVFEAWADDLVIPRPFLSIALPGVVADSMEAHHAYARRPFWVVGRRHSALAGRDRKSVV